MLTTAALVETSLTDTIGRYFTHTVRNCHQVQTRLRRLGKWSRCIFKKRQLAVTTKDVNLNQKEN